jgi:SNF2 family DNA or RNA helicase
MGINLSSADVLIFYNIDFSAVQYWQARARLQTLNRTKPAVVHWLFTQDGIEEKIYKAVLKKKDYTTYYFKKDYLDGKWDTSKNHKVSGIGRSLRA